MLNSILWVSCFGGRAGKWTHGCVANWEDTCTKPSKTYGSTQNVGMSSKTCVLKCPHLKGGRECGWQIHLVCPSHKAEHGSMIYIQIKEPPKIPFPKANMKPEKAPLKDHFALAGTFSTICLASEVLGIRVHHHGPC